MGPRFKDTDRYTLFLMPPSLDDWIPENHLAQFVVDFVVDIVSHLDLSAIRNAYAGRGSEDYPPSIMTALLFHAYATGLFSSRKIEQATYDFVAFRFMAVNSHPDHDTITRFRKKIPQRAEGSVHADPVDCPWDETHETGLRKPGWDQD